MATRYAMTRFLKSSSIVLLLSPEIGIAFTRAEPRTLSNTVESGSATFTNGRIDLIPFDKLRVSFPPGHPAGIRAEALFLAVRLNGKKSMTLFAQALFAIGFGNRVAAAVCFNRFHWQPGFLRNLAVPEPALLKYNDHAFLFLCHPFCPPMK